MQIRSTAAQSSIWRKSPTYRRTLHLNQEQLRNCTTGVSKTTIAIQGLSAIQSFEGAKVFVPLQYSSGN
jgi:hypothetical protein